MKYLLITNNTKVRDLINLSEDVQINYEKCSVKEIIQRCTDILLEEKFTLMIDPMAGRRARAFPYLTLILKEKGSDDAYEEQWDKLLDYEMLDAKRQDVYASYKDDLNNDFRTLDCNYVTTVLKKLYGFQENFDSR